MRLVCVAKLQARLLCYAKKCHLLILLSSNKKPPPDPKANRVLPAVFRRLRQEECTSDIYIERERPKPAKTNNKPFFLFLGRHYFVTTWRFDAFPTPTGPSPAFPKIDLDTTLNRLVRGRPTCLPIMLLLWWWWCGQQQTTKIQKSNPCAFG
jgi:hypothetical protein